MHCSLVYQFEHSGKVRRAWFKFGFENFYSSLLSGSASFLCAALMSPQRTKQYCPQIEFIYIYIYVFTIKANSGKVHPWSFQNFAMRGCQDPPVLPEFRIRICRAGRETSPRYHISCYPTSASSISWESSWGKKLTKGGPSPETNASVVQHAYTNNSFHIPNVRVVFCVCIIVLSYAGK